MILYLSRKIESEYKRLDERYSKDKYAFDLNDFNTYDAVSKQRKSIKGRRQNSCLLTTNFSQNVTEPSKRISYPVGDLFRHFTKLTGSSAYTLHGNLIPQTDGTNGLL